MLNYWPKKFRWVSHLNTFTQIHLCSYCITVRISCFLFLFVAISVPSSLVLGNSHCHGFSYACGYFFRFVRLLSCPLRFLSLYSDYSIPFLFPFPFCSLCVHLLLCGVFHCDIFAYVYCKCFMFNALILLGIFLFCQRTNKGLSNSNATISIFVPSVFIYF